MGAADFNGDGKPDLVWRNDSTRQVVVWYVGAPRAIRSSARIGLLVASRAGGQLLSIDLSPVPRALVSQSRLTKGIQA